MPPVLHPVMSTTCPLAVGFDALKKAPMASKNFQPQTRIHRLQSYARISNRRSVVQRQEGVVRQECETWRVRNVESV